MTRQKRNEDLLAQGFERVERDDRLMDVFPQENTEKGIELWDRWNIDKVDIIRIHLPKAEQGIQSYAVSRKKIEEALLTYQKLLLE